MTIDTDLRNRLTALFGPLNNVAASKSLPPPSTLADALAELTPRLGATYRNVLPELASCFGTAAVEIWLRSVHSLLISTSLTKASPIWSSVSGYYSSHYSIRGIAHLLGYFYFFNGNTIIKLETGTSGYKSSIFPKPSGLRSNGEHQLYWALVRRDSNFSADPFFTENKQSDDESDAGHRNFANYIDHINNYPTFHPLDRDLILERIDRISKIVPTDTPIPRRSKFPDVEYVQLVAYHRMIIFRKLLDEVLNTGRGNRFWNVHRNPSFATEFMSFQTASVDGLEQPN